MASIALFEDISIRKERYNDERWFSVIDVVGYLTNSNNPRRYRSDLKIKMNKYEGYHQVYENIVQLKMKSLDGKQRETDSANTQLILRIIQSIPSPNAEPLKQRLAALGSQRIEEYEDPELGIQRANERAIAKYKAIGMIDEEIKQRLEQIKSRNDFTKLIQTRGGDAGYGILTNIGYERTGMTAEQYKLHKGLKPKGDNLRDHQTKLEMLLTTVSEEASSEIIKQKDMKGFDDIQQAVKQGANVAKKAKDELESYTGTTVISKKNRLTSKQQVIRNKINNKPENSES